jgi:hypothetical protein
MSKEMRQKAFDKVARALLKQGCRAVSGTSNVCHYLNAKGERCAIGWLLSGKALEFASETFGGLSTLKQAAIDERVKLPNFIRDEKNEDFLSYLQGAHDNSYSSNWLENWKEEMITIAKRYRLNSSVLKGKKKVTQ